MKTLKLLLAGIVVGVIVVAFRDMERGTWLAPALPRNNATEVDGEEPVLGYDGMDQETLIEWLDSAGLDQSTLERILAYEGATRGREQVMLAVSDKLG
jgi:hypothetical protein